MAWIVSHLIYSKGITSTSDRNKEKITKRFAPFFMLLFQTSSAAGSMNNE